MIEIMFPRKESNECLENARSYFDNLKNLVTENLPNTSYWKSYKERVNNVFNLASASRDSYNCGNFHKAFLDLNKAVINSVCIYCYGSFDDAYYKDVEHLNLLFENMRFELRFDKNMRDITSNNLKLKQNINKFICYKTQRVLGQMLFSPDSADEYIKIKDTYASLLASAAYVIAFMLLFINPTPVLRENGCLELKKSLDSYTSITSLFEYDVINKDALDVFKKTKVYQDKYSYFNNSYLLKFYGPMNVDRL